MTKTLNFDKKSSTKLFLTKAPKFDKKGSTNFFLTKTLQFGAWPPGLRTRLIMPFRVWSGPAGLGCTAPGLRTRVCHLGIGAAPPVEGALPRNCARTHARRHACTQARRHASSQGVNISGAPFWGASQVPRNPRFAPFSGCGARTSFLGLRRKLMFRAVKGV